MYLLRNKVKQGSDYVSIKGQLQFFCNLQVRSLKKFRKLLFTAKYFEYLISILMLFLHNQISIVSHISLFCCKHRKLSIRNNMFIIIRLPISRSRARCFLSQGLLVVLYLAALRYNSWTLSAENLVKIKTICNIL